MSGLLGYGACYPATHEADLLVLLGTDFPYTAFLPQARSIQVDHVQPGLAGARPSNSPSTAMWARPCAPSCRWSDRRQTAHSSTGCSTSTSARSSTPWTPTPTTSSVGARYTPS